MSGFGVDEFNTDRSAADIIDDAIDRRNSAAPHLPRVQVGPPPEPLCPACGKKLWVPYLELVAENRECNHCAPRSQDPAEAPTEPILKLIFKTPLPSADHPCGRDIARVSQAAHFTRLFLADLPDFTPVFPEWQDGEGHSDPAGAVCHDRTAPKMAMAASIGARITLAIALFWLAFFPGNDGSPWRALFFLLPAMVLMAIESKRLVRARSEKSRLLAVANLLEADAERHNADGNSTLGLAEAIQKELVLRAAALAEKRVALLSALDSLPESLGKIWSDEYRDPCPPDPRDDTKRCRSLLKYHPIENGPIDSTTARRLRGVDIQTADDCCRETLLRHQGILTPEMIRGLAKWRDSLALKSRLQPFEDWWRLVARHRIWSHVATIVSRSNALRAELTAMQRETDSRRSEMRRLLLQARVSKESARRLEFEARAAREAASRAGWCQVFT